MSTREQRLGNARYALRRVGQTWQLQAIELDDVTVEPDVAVALLLVAQLRLYAIIIAHQLIEVAVMYLRSSRA